jgi:hypothetical protein
MTAYRRHAIPFDVAFSDRHRDLYGVNMPCMDIDFLGIESDMGQPRVLIDYKRAFGPSPKFVGSIVPAAYRPMVILADNSAIPAVIAEYWPDYQYAFRVQALNQPAAERLWRPGSPRAVIGGVRDFAEYEFVAWMHYVRGRVTEATAIKHTRRVASARITHAILGATRPPHPAAQRVYTGGE